MERVPLFSKRGLLDIIMCYFRCGWVVIDVPMT
jgi:hypothetical protein